MRLAVTFLLATAIGLSSAQFGRPQPSLSIPNAPSAAEVRSVVQTFPQYLRSTACGGQPPRLARCRKSGQLLKPDLIIPPNVNSANMNFAAAKRIFDCQPHVVFCLNGDRFPVNHGGSVGRKLVDELTSEQAMQLLREAFP